MFLVGILSWWYSSGWLAQFQMVKTRLQRSADFFSVRLLISTLFSPFRQISAESAAVSLNDHIRAFFDKLLSRVIGAVVRSFMIIFGLIVMSLQIIFSAIILIVWLIIPTLVVVGLIASVIGLVPQWSK